MQHTDALLSSHFPNVKGIIAAKDFTLNEREGGYFGCTIDGDHQMGGENKKPKKSPGLPTKPPKIPGPQLSPRKIPCRISKP